MSAGEAKDRWMNVDEVLRLAKERLDRDDVEGAEHLLRQIVSFQPRHVDAHHYLSLASYRQGRLREAIRHAEKAARLAPKNAVFHSNLAQMYRLAGKLPEARSEGQQALALKPEFPEALNNLGIVCFEMANYADAEDCYRRALAQRADFPEALNNLGNALRHAGRPEAAAAAFRDALARRPDYSEALANWGIVERDQGRLQEAETLLQRALEANPKNPVAHQAHAVLALLKGDWASGLPEFEWRMALPGFKRPRHRGEAWSGQPLAGKRLLVFAEQGLGETIAFVRFLPALGALAPSEIVLLVEGRLVALLTACLPGVAVVERVSPLEAFDYSVPLQSLPLRLGLTGPDSLKPTPYLAADPAIVARWRVRLADRPRPWIAVAWRGERSRLHDAVSIPLPVFSPLFGAAEGTFLLTQSGEGAPPEARCLALEGDLSDYAELAALVSLSDRVIAVDGPLAHLAGALGKDSWVLLPAVPDWRWGLSGASTPLYARARLFRASPAASGPQDLIESVAAAARAE